MKRNLPFFLANALFTLGVIALLYSFNIVRADQVSEPNAPSAFTQAITYQGQLLDGGTAANGQYDIEATLFDSVSGGLQVGTTATIPNVTVADGLFSAELPLAAASLVAATAGWKSVYDRRVVARLRLGTAPSNSTCPQRAQRSMEWHCRCASRFC